VATILTENTAILCPNIDQNIDFHEEQPIFAENGSKIAEKSDQYIDLFQSISRPYI
jgi:hypothetical protein